MKSIPPELVYALLFAGIILFQYIMKRFAPPEPQPAPLPEFPEDAPEAVKALPAARSEGGKVAAQFGRTGAKTVSAPRSKRRFSRQVLMGSRQAVQNAIVIATILGPCRANAPHDVR